MAEESGPAAHPTPCRALSLGRCLAENLALRRSMPWERSWEHRRPCLLVSARPPDLSQVLVPPELFSCSAICISNCSSTRVSPKRRASWSMTTERS